VGRRLVVEADGGSRGNPGVAGYGALVRDPVSGRVLAERAAPLGKQSNNVAEYTGLIEGLRAAALIDPGAEVHVRMDSKLVVEQMSGRWKIKHEDMRRLALEARDLVAGFATAGGSVVFEWIPRADNKAADALSNHGMDGRTIVRDLASNAAQRAGAADAPEPWGETGSGTVVDEEATQADVVIDPDDADAGPGPTRIVLVRHGVTAFTEQHRLDGRGGADPGLSDTGREQAARAAGSVVALVGERGARLVTSSLARARETGAFVAAALGVEATVDDAWDELSFGDWDGKAIRDILRDEPEAWAAMRVDPTFRRPGGESHEELSGRVVPAWEALLAEGGTSVVVCHRIVIMTVLAHVLQTSTEAAWRVAAGPGSLTAFEVLPHGELSIAFTNRT
jgi:probable phosphoglycerate mutase